MRIDHRPRQQLVELVERFGVELAADPRRCQALLMDLCPQCKREIFLLICAAKESIPAVLLNKSCDIPKDVLHSRLSNQLHENLGIVRMLARWAVESWALALGTIAQQDLPLKDQPPRARGPNQPVHADEQPGRPAGEVRTFHEHLNLRMVWCPPGGFWMGEVEGYYNEKPPHLVRLTRGFWLGQTVVTQAQWQAVLRTCPWQGKEYVHEGADYPATYLSHEDALAFCQQLTDQEQRAGRLAATAEYRLPTEAEWEYACRAGTTTQFSFGDDESRLGEFGWWGGMSGNGNAKHEKNAHRVGLKKANPWGLFDMHGNVYEWCGDWFDTDYYARSPQGDPLGPPSGDWRVLRGGSWRIRPAGCRSSFRDWGAPGYRSSDAGFRLARTE